MADYNTAEIRKFITDSFNDEELTIFVYDYFRDIYEQFSTKMSKTLKIQRLIEGSERSGMLPNLLTALRTERTELYDEKFGNLILETQPEQNSTERDPKQVFISYAYDDTRFAHDLADDLEKQGWQIWIAPESIRPGEKWVNGINRGLEECGSFLLVLTPASVNSNWVESETNTAIRMEHDGLLKFIPMMVESVDSDVIPPLWSNYQFISFLGDYETDFAHLLEGLESTPLPSKTLKSHKTKQSPLVAALSHNRRVVIVITLLVFTIAAIGVWLITRPPPPTCQIEIGQQAHVVEGKNIWSEPGVFSGGTTWRTPSLIPVNVIGGPVWESTTTDYPEIKHWWWEVSDPITGERLGWVYDNFFEECQINPGS